MELDYYQTIEKKGEAEYKDRGSRFIGMAFPAVSALMVKDTLQEIKKVHPKAVHHCFAYRLGTDGNSFRAFDDGEPSGSAGKPILGQIDSRVLTNTAVVVVRYFGGTLLGVPGLIQAYKSAAALALQMVPIVQKPITTNYSIDFDYTDMHTLFLLIKQLGGIVSELEHTLFSRCKVEIPRTIEAQFLSKVNDLRNIIVKKI